MKFDKHIALTPWFAGALLYAATATPLVAQEAKLELEQKPIPELPNSISGTDTVRSRMDKFIREQGLREVKDTKKTSKVARC